MHKRTIHLSSEQARENAKRLIDEAPDGFVARIGEATRTDEQNRLMWPLIKDMSEQIDGMNMFTADQIKLRFLNALGNELQFLPELEGVGMFPVGQRSSTLSKSQFSGLIDLMFAYGGKYGVRWSAKSQQTIDTVASRLS